MKYTEEQQTLIVNFLSDALDHFDKEKEIGRFYLDELNDIETSLVRDVIKHLAEIPYRK